MLRALLVALFALAAGAFFAPMAAPRAAIEARSVKIQMDIAFNFNDEALDNPAIAEDKHAQPARKCASCFG